jgi:hypothetical protein
MPFDLETLAQKTLGSVRFPIALLSCWLLAFEPRPLRFFRHPWWGFVLANKRPVKMRL